MIEFPKDFKEFLQLLNSKEIEYLVIGGYAVGYHGYPRATGDMDTCFKNRVIVDLGDFKVNFMSKGDLLINKRSSGRPQDLVDFDKLLNQ